MKQLILWIGLAFLTVGCAPQTSVNVPLGIGGKYGTTNINLGSEGDIQTNVDANLKDTNVNTTF